MAMLPWCDGTIRYRVIAPSKMVFEENGGRPFHCYYDWFITIQQSCILLLIALYC